MILKRLCKNFLFTFWPSFATVHEYPECFRSNEDDGRSATFQPPDSYLALCICLAFGVLFDSLQVGLSIALLWCFAQNLRYAFLDILFYLKIHWCSMSVYVIIYSISAILGYLQGILTAAPEAFRIRPKNSKELCESHSATAKPVYKEDPIFYNGLRQELRRRRLIAEAAKHPCHDPKPDPCITTRIKTKVSYDGIRQKSNVSLKCKAHSDLRNRKPVKVARIDHKESRSVKQLLDCVESSAPTIEDRYVRRESEHHLVQNNPTTKTQLVSCLKKNDNIQLQSESPKARRKKRIIFKVEAEENKKSEALDSLMTKVTKPEIIQAINLNQDGDTILDANTTHKLRKVGPVIVGILKKNTTKIPKTNRDVTPTPASNQKSGYSQQFRERQNKSVPAKVTPPIPKKKVATIPETQKVKQNKKKHNLLKEKKNS